MDIGTHGITLARCSDLTVKLEEERCAKFDVIGFSEIGRNGEAFIEVIEGHNFI